jgi:vacuolar-type H+-ATPase subunit I/STV1
MSNGYLNRLKIREKLKNDFAAIKQALSLQRSGALNTGYTLEELETELKRRQKVLQKFQSKAERHRKKARKYYREAEKAVYSRKITLYGQGKRHAIRVSLYHELAENLMVQQIFLENTVVEATKKKFYGNQMEDIFGINLADLNQEAIGNALHRSEIDHSEVNETMQDIYIDMESKIDDEDRIVPNIQALREQAHTADGSDKAGQPDIAPDLTGTIDDEIQDELERLDSNAETSQEPVADGGLNGEPDDGGEEVS